MLGCCQHFTRVTVALGGSAASTRAGRINPAPTPPRPTASDLNSDLRFIFVALFLSNGVRSGGAFYANAGSAGIRSKRETCSADPAHDRGGRRRAASGAAG